MFFSFKILTTTSFSVEHEKGVKTTGNNEDGKRSFPHCNNVFGKKKS